MPAKAGIQIQCSSRCLWTPAFAGMTNRSGALAEPSRAKPYGTSEMIIDPAVLRGGFVPDPDRAPEGLELPTQEPHVWPRPCPAVFCEPVETVPGVGLDIHF